MTRINAELTQERLAELVSLSPSHMSNIETGTTRVSLTTLVSIANALSVTADDLLYDNLIHARSQLEQELQKLLDGCDEYELRVVREVASSVVNVLRANEKLKNG